MLCFLEEIIKWSDEGSPVDIICLDFQKVFDIVPPQRLLLKAHGVGDGIIDWIEKWLTDRRQHVDREVSNWKSVLSGVSQASNTLKCVDDTKVLRKVNNDGDKQHLQNDLDKLVKWS